MFKDGSEYDVSLKGKYYRDADWRKQLTQRNLKQKNAVVTPKGYFVGTTEAHKAYGYKCKNSIIAKCRSNDPKYADWYYVETGPVEVDYNLPDPQEERIKNMLTKYGKKSLAKPTHTFAGVSLFDFLDNNIDTVLTLVDENHKYKYHKVHAYILENLTSDTTPSQNYRSATICKWFKLKLEETA